MNIAEIVDVRVRSRAGDSTARSLARHLVRLLGTREAGTLRTADVLAYRKQREAEGASPASVNRELRELRAALNMAADLELLEAAPRVKWRILRETPRHRVLSREEVRCLLDALPGGWHREVFLVLVGTGARVMEVLEARPADCHFDGGAFQLVVPSPKEGDPKVLVATGAPAEAARRLASRGLSRPFARREGTTPRSDYFSFWRALRRVSGRVLDEEVHPHDLRRTYASTALRAGVPLEQVGQALGHRSLETTRRYARIDEGTRARVAEAVAGGLGVG